MFVHESWTWDTLRATPDWVVERAILWADVVGAWRKAQAEKKS